MEDGEIVGVKCHGMMMIFWSDITWICGCCCIKKDVRKNDSKRGQDFLGVTHEWPCWGNEHDLGDREEKDEKYLKKMLECDLKCSQGGISRYIEMNLSRTGIDICVR
jgi:hypothetical protein